MATANPLRRSERERTRRKQTPEEATSNEEIVLRNGERVRARHPWTRDNFLDDLYRASAAVAAEIAANPDEEARLKKSQSDIEEGNVRWDDDGEEGEG